MEVCLKATLNYAGQVQLNSVCRVWGHNEECMNPVPCLDFSSIMSQVLLGCRTHDLVCEQGQYIPWEGFVPAAVHWLLTQQRAPLLS